MAIHHIEDLLQVDDSDFVNAAYQLILGRAPDESGGAFYLARIQSGVDRARVIKEIRFSAEGRRRAVDIPGLSLAILGQVLRDAPGIGPLFRHVCRRSPSAGHGPASPVALSSAEPLRRGSEELIRQLRVIAARNQCQ